MILIVNKPSCNKYIINGEIFAESSPTAFNSFNVNNQQQQTTSESPAVMPMLPHEEHPIMVPHRPSTVVPHAGTTTTTAHMVQEQVRSSVLVILLKNFL